MESPTNDTVILEESFPYGSVIILGLMIVFTVFGNIFTLIVFILNKSLRTSNNNLVISLCTADLLTGFLVIPFALVNIINEGWLLGVGACAFYLVLNISLYIASVYSVCTIVIVRACAAQFPIFYRSNFTKKASVVIAITVWLFSFLNGGYMIIGWFIAPQYVLCHVGLLDSGYVFSTAIMSFIIPLLIMVLGSVFLIHALRRQSKKIQRNAEEENANKASERRTRHETAATRQAIIITLGFLICNLSFFSYYLLSAFYPNFPFSEQVYLILVWIMYFNSSLNPWLYVIINKRVRTASFRLLSRCARRSRVVQGGLEMRSVDSYTQNQTGTNQ